MGVMQMTKQERAGTGYGYFHRYKQGQLGGSTL